MSIVDRLLGRRGWELLRPHERAVLEAIGEVLAAEPRELLRLQIGLIASVSRQFSGADVYLYRPPADRGRSGPHAFPARAPELRLATVTLVDSTSRTVRARVDAVWGDVFTINFAAEPSPSLRATGVKLHADPMDPASGLPGQAGSALSSLPAAILGEYQRLLAAPALSADADGKILRPDEVYGIDIELGSMIVVGVVREEHVLVRTDDGAVFRAAPDDDPRGYPSIEAALSSEA